MVLGSRPLLWGGVGVKDDGWHCTAWPMLDASLPECVTPTGSLVVKKLVWGRIRAWVVELNVHGRARCVDWRPTALCAASEPNHLL